MQTRTHHVLIGLFVLLACAGAMVFGLWLSQSNGNDARHYQVLFTESVRGLSVGSLVEYNGIAVGEVAGLRLDPTDPARVLARIRVRRDVPVRADTEATLAMQGLTGRSIIQLRGGTLGSPMLDAAPNVEPVITARPSSVARMLDQGEHTVANLNALILAAQPLFAPDNIAHMQQTLENLAQLTHTLNTQSAQAGAVLVSVQDATRSIQKTFQNVSTLTRDLQRTVATHAPHIASNLDRSAASLADGLHEAHQLLRHTQGPLRQSLQGATAIGPALQELRATLAALRNTVERLNQDPAAYLLNRSPLQEFTP